MLDPANPLVINFAAYHFDRARQPSGALRAAEYAQTSFPEIYAYWRATIQANFAGRTEEMHSCLEHFKPANDPARLVDSLADYFLLLMYEHRYAELRARIDRVPVASSNYYSGVDFGPTGQTPTALLRGWTDMLLSDQTAAMKDGRAVFQFAERQARTEWNAAHLEMLRAAGYAFTGDCRRARAAADSSLMLVRPADNAVIWTTHALEVAPVDAWCGNANDAISLLQRLSKGRPGVGPAVITRDPLSLYRSARYLRTRH